MPGLDLSWDRSLKSVPREKSNVNNVIFPSCEDNSILISLSYDFVS
jgi:hypothetical protein